MARLYDRQFIGLGGHVVAVDAASGSEIWRTRLKASDVVTLCASSGDEVVAAVRAKQQAAAAAAAAG